MDSLSVDSGSLKKIRCGALDKLSVDLGFVKSCRGVPCGRISDLVDDRPGCSSWAHMVGMLSMAGRVVALPLATGPKQKDYRTPPMRATHGHFEHP